MHKHTDTATGTDTHAYRNSCSHEFKNIRHQMVCSSKTNESEKSAQIKLTQSMDLDMKHTHTHIYYIY